jgi:hypothetical protein
VFAVRATGLLVMIGLGAASEHQIGADVEAERLIFVRPGEDDELEAHDGLWKKISYGLRLLSAGKDETLCSCWR